MAWLGDNARHGRGATQLGDPSCAQERRQDMYAWWIGSFPAQPIALAVPIFVYGELADTVQGTADAPGSVWDSAELRPAHPAGRGWCSPARRFNGARHFFPLYTPKGMAQQVSKEAGLLTQWVLVLHPFLDGVPSRVDTGRVRDKLAHGVIGALVIRQPEMHRPGFKVGPAVIIHCLPACR